MTEATITSVQSNCQSITSVCEGTLELMLTKMMPLNYAKVLIQIAKESPIGIAMDIATPIVIYYSSDNNMFTIVSNR